MIIMHDHDPGLHKKISNLGPEKKLMTNLPKRPPVDIEFNNLSYSGDDDDDDDKYDDDEYGDNDNTK